METQDAHNASKTPEEIVESYKKALDAIEPIVENNTVMEAVRMYLMGLPAKEQLDCEEVIGVYLRVFTNMVKSLKGETLDISEVETLFMSETMMLDLNNPWYRSVKPILEPTIANCKISLVTALQLKNRDHNIKHESDSDTMWFLMMSAWDFIPWIIFIRTGKMKNYVSSKELFTRMISISKEHFGL